MKLINQKWISVITIIAILGTLLCGFGVTATAEESVPYVTTISQMEEDFLFELGIIRSHWPAERDDYLAKTMTRAGMAQILSRVAGIDPYLGEDTYFTDVPVSHTNAKEINALAMAGLVKGDGDGKFRPDDAVTAEEMATLCCIVLGYKIVGTNDSYPVVANRIGLFDGIELSGDNFTIGQFYRMVLNTLDTEVMEQVTFGDKDEYAVQDGLTILECYHGLVKQRGVVEGAYGTRLSDADSSIGQNQLLIGGRVYVYENTEGLLGREIVFYSQKDKMTGGTKQKIEFLYVDEERNNYLELEGKAIEGLDENYFVYFDGSKEKKVQVSTTLDVLLNGVAYPEYKPEDLKPACGTVTLLDNNDDNIYDVILIDEYTFMMVESINKEEGIIYGKYPNITVGAQNQEELYQIYMEAGIVGELGFLIPGDMVAIRTSKNTKGARVITVNYLGEGTSGVLEGIYKDTYTIDGVEYEITGATVMDEDPYLLGQTVTVYTHNGLCAGVIHPDNDGYKFGYLIDAKVKESAFSGTLMVRIVNQQRELQEFATGKKFLLDESEYTDANRALTQLQTAADKRIFAPDMKTAIDAGNANTVSRTDVKTLDSYGMLTQLKSGEANFPLSQPVRYRVNDEGLLTHLDTINKGANETEQSLTPFQRDGGTDYAEMEAAMYSSNDRGFYIYDGNGTTLANLINTANVLMPPCDERDKVEYYGTGSIVNESYCAVEVYSVNEYRMARYAVVYNKIHTAVYEENNIYILGDIEKSLNEEGEVVRKATFLGYNGPYVRVLSKDIDDSTIAVGDVVRFQVNTNNEVTHIETYYAVKDGDVASAQRIKQSGQNRAWGSRNRMAYGTALAFSNNLISHTTSVGEDVYKKENIRNYYVGATSFYRYTNEGGDAKVEMVSSGDLVPYETDPKTNQKVVMITYSNRLDVVYIIDKK